MNFMKPKYLALFIAAATSSAFAAAPGAPSIGSGNDKFALVEVDQPLRIITVWLKSIMTA